MNEFRYLSIVSVVGLGVACGGGGGEPTGTGTSGVDLRIETLYLVQSVQTREGAVPLVADKDAYLRVFVVASGANTLTLGSRPAFAERHDRADAHDPGQRLVRPDERRSIEHGQVVERENWRPRSSPASKSWPMWIRRTRYQNRTSRTTIFRRTDRRRRFRSRHCNPSAFDSCRWSRRKTAGPVESPPRTLRII